MSTTMEELEVCEVIARNCAYGFSAHCVMSDGSTAFHTTRLHASAAQAVAETSALARAGRGAA